MIKILYIPAFVLLLFVVSCKNRKKVVSTPEPAVQAEDTISGGRCRLDYKSARTLGKKMKEQELKFEWLNLKANVESHFEDQEESFDIRVALRKDSAMLVTIQYLLGLQVAKVLITTDSVKFVNYIKKSYFKGDFKYINDLLNADLDFDLLQAVLVGNSAEFFDEESRLKPVADRQNCRYLLSTERKKRLRKIQAGEDDLTSAMQTLTLNSDYKIIINEFIDPRTDRRFIASYSSFAQKDSVYAPYHVDIDLVAQKKGSIKIDYVRIEKNTPQKLTLNIPSKYDPIQIQKKEK